MISKPTKCGKDHSVIGPASQNQHQDRSFRRKTNTLGIEARQARMVHNCEARCAVFVAHSDLMVIVMKEEQPWPSVNALD